MTASLRLLHLLSLGLWIGSVVFFSMIVAAFPLAVVPRSPR